MKKLLIFALLLCLLPINTANAVYTMDIIYGDYDESSAKEPYLLHSTSFFPMEPVEILLATNSIYFHYGHDEASVNLSPQLMPINARHDKKITYTSSDPSVATVDDNGNVTSKNKLGSTIITAKCGKISATCKVSVIIGVESVEIKDAPKTLYADKPVATQLRAVIKPDNASIKKVKWQTSDASIATVDRTGMLMPCGKGTVTITATTVDNNISASATITVDVWAKREGDAKSEINYSSYPYTLSEATQIQANSNPTVFTSNAYPATVDDVKEYIDPSVFTNGYELYQFLDLSKSNGVSKDLLNSYLSGKGVLDGMGDVFSESAQAEDISEVYLVVHSCLETANGMSELANGIEYNGETVYNVFGIGAVDSDPIGGGALYAYQNGWTSVEEAIRGGAKWISKYYIHNPDYPQNTLYTMRWNPTAPGVHQYASDVAWSSKQAQTLKNMFDAFPNAKLTFDYPLYEGEEKPNITLE